MELRGIEQVINGMFGEVFKYRVWLFQFEICRHSQNEIDSELINDNKLENATVIDERCDRTFRGHQL